MFSLMKVSDLKADCHHLFFWLKINIFFCIVNCVQFTVLLCTVFNLPQFISMRESHGTTVDIR